MKFAPVSGGIPAGIAPVQLSPCHCYGCGISYFGGAAMLRRWWSIPDLNRKPGNYKLPALPVALMDHIITFHYQLSIFNLCGGSGRTRTSLCHPRTSQDPPCGYPGCPRHRADPYPRISPGYPSLSLVPCLRKVIIPRVNGVWPLRHGSSPRAAHHTQLWLLGPDNAPGGRSNMQRAPRLPL